MRIYPYILISPVLYLRSGKMNKNTNYIALVRAEFKVICAPKKKIRQNFASKYVAYVLVLVLDTIMSGTNLRSDSV